MSDQKMSETELEQIPAVAPARVSLAVALLAILGLAAAPHAATAQPAAKAFETAPVYQPPAGATFAAVSDLKQTGTVFQPQLRAGQVAVPAEWPASFVLVFDTPEGRAACTGALIGPEVMLTAAHCVPTTGKVTLVRGGQTLSDANCTHHPGYPMDASADFALCRILTPFTPASFVFERVRTAAMDNVVAAKSVLLSGYGCTSDKVADQGNSDGKYRIGPGLVDESSDSPLRKRGAFYYRGNENNNLFTVDDGVQTHANICPGDSGGPAFVLTSGPGKATDNRVIVAVNSRVFFNLTRTRFTGSLLSALGGPDFDGWARGWLGATSACGLQGALKCR